MPLTLYFDDNFSNSPATGSRSATYPTSPGGAGSTTGVGNGWVDAAGGVWFIDSANLLHAAGPNVGSGSNTSAYLNRPASESHVAQQVVVTYSATYTADSQYCVVDPCLRVQANGDRYFVNVSPLNGIQLNRVVGGTVTQIALWGVSFPSGHQMQASFSAAAPSGGATTLAVILTDLTAGTTVLDQTATDAAPSLQSAGTAGLVAADYASSNGMVARVQLYQGDATPTFTLAPTSGPPGTTITATGSNTSWTSGTTFTGAAFTNTTVNATTQVATFVVPSGQAAGAITIGDSTDSATATFTVTPASGGGGSGGGSSITDASVQADDAAALVALGFTSSLASQLAALPSAVAALAAAVQGIASKIGTPANSTVSADIAALDVPYDGVCRGPVPAGFDAVLDPAESACPDGTTLAFIGGTDDGKVCVASDFNLTTKAVNLKLLAVNAATGAQTLSPLSAPISSGSQYLRGLPQFGASPGGPAAGTDPWSVVLAAGNYPAGSAGSIVLTNLDARVSSRSTFAGGAVASVTAPVTVGTNVDKGGYLLAPAGLDSIATAPQAPGATPNFREMVVMTWRRWFKQAGASGATLTCYQDDGVTPLTTQAIPAVAAPQVQGAAQ